ncbi:hypothetical protein [Streptomyces antibioticus]|uniref:hypothetical protein n=1 Tax=Streptomyces antibioticus TaxID=1890 RepID=UPI0036FF9AC2
MPSPPTSGPVGRTAAALLRRLRPRGAQEQQAAVPRPRLALDLDDCRQERERWQRHADSYERELSLVARERAHLLAWLAALHPASAVITPAPDGGTDGTHLLRLVAGERQLSWRLPPADLPLFAHVPYMEPTGTPSPGDGRRSPDQAAHIRRHTRLLALEGSLFTAPVERRPPPVRPGDR